MGLSTPVALLIFNRPDLTESVCARIAAAAPERVFVIADGPRPGRPEDLERTAAARRVIDETDWPCPVHKNYSEVNLGCGRGPDSGLDWVFEQTDRAIILEDDCIPHPSFFPYCEELLERYKDDERVMQVSGNNFQNGQRRGNASYFFSRHNICAGGWATWKRAWRHYDVGVSLWPALRGTAWLRYVLGSDAGADMYEGIFDRAHEEAAGADYWDYQWTFACWAHNGLSALPNVTLVSNVGFREDGTHTLRPTRWAGLPMEPMAFPLSHPPAVMPDADADLYVIEQWVLHKGRKPKTLQEKIRARVSPMVPDVIKRQLSVLRAR